MAEVEFAGVKFKGGKMVAVVMALSTLGGGLYAGFEFYKDYMNMREKIEKYTAPDLSEFDKKLAVLNEEMSSLKTEMAGVVQLEKIIKESADDARDYTKDIKRDLKEEIHHMSKQVDDIEKRGKEAFRLVRESIDTNDTKVRKMVSDATDRFDKRREQTRNDMEALELRSKIEMKDLKKDIYSKIKKALENPLANMRK
jgi:DNA-binding MarR family transcriptional regulator